MKKMIRYIAMLSVAAMLAVMLPGKVYALNPKDEMAVSSLGYAYTHLGEDAAFESIKISPVSSGVVQTLVNAGFFPNHVEELKALGYTDVDYSPVTGGSSEPQTSVQDTAPASEPAAFTVEDMPETPMWAISEVNCRDGASTDYTKIGSLAKDEEVTVNGRASTGWYRFVLADGTEAYVSDKYLTAEDPNEAPEPEEAAPEPEPEEEPVVEEPEAIVEEPEVETPAPEPVVEEPEQIVEPPVVKEEATGNWIPIAVGVVAAVCVVGGVSFVLIRRKKG